MTEVVRFQRCVRCAAVSYLVRGFCPRCGGEIEVIAASGRGVVAAITTVSRAPSPELQALAPYALCLVDAEEGFRMMTHADPALAIGDAVQVAFASFGDLRIPRADAPSDDPTGEQGA